MAATQDERTAKITGQTPSAGIGEGNKPGTGFEVNFQTALGNNGRVFIPTAQFTPDNVRNIVAQQAAALDDIMSTPVKY